MAEKLNDFILILIAVIAIIIAKVFNPFHVDQGVIDAILIVATFFFGIFISFAISDREKRLDSIRENDSEERTSLTSLFHFSRNFGRETESRIKNGIDKYLMATLDYEIWDYDKTEKEFHELFADVTSIKPGDEREKLMCDKMYDLLIKIDSSRKQTISLIGERLSKTEWFTFALLSLVIIIPILLISTETVLSTIICIVLSFSVVLILALLRKLDSLEWKEEERIFEPYEKTFESIGLMRYYPNDIIRSGKVRMHKNHDFRLASYPNAYPDMSGKLIRIVKKQKN